MNNKAIFTLFLAITLGLFMAHPTMAQAEETREVVDQIEETNCTTSGAYGQDETCTKTTTKKIVIRDGKVLGAHDTVDAGFEPSYLGLPLLAIGSYLIAKKTILS